MLRGGRRHPQPRHRCDPAQRHRMGAHAPRGGRRAGRRGRGLHDRRPHRLRRQLRPRQPALHQRPLRKPSQPRAGGADREPGQQLRTRRRLPAGGRFQTYLPRLQRLLRGAQHPIRGAPNDHPGRPGRPHPARRGGADRAWRRQRRGDRRRPGLRGACPLARGAPQRRRTRSHRRHAQRGRQDRGLCRDRRRERPRAGGSARR